MAQRKTPSSTSKKPGARPASGNGPGARPASGNGPGARPGAGAGRPVNSNSGRPPARKPGKSIVNQKQTPWALIIVTVVLVLFAGSIVAYAVFHNSSTSSAGGMKANSANQPYVRPEIAAAKKIKGMIYKPEIKHNHVDGTVKYDTSPPIGGNHNQFWANCTGTVYKHQIANENAVHMLEHGAVWITYNPKTATAADVKALKTLVAGVDRMALSPYAGLKTPISLQAWDYQLFVNKASDPRVAQFVDALRYNSKTTPELNASCSDPQFDASKSTPGHPFSGTS